jgi:TolA-binding protein
MAKARALRSAGGRIAATLDEALKSRPRASIDGSFASARARLDERRARRRSLRQTFAVAAIASLAAAALAVLLLRPAQLTFAVDGTTGHPGDWVAATDRERHIGFSDGSRFTVPIDTRARVLDVSAAGARIALERGELLADVIHLDGRAWQVAAGPFVIHVVGTRFRASWDAVDEALTVELYEGRVEISGSCLTETRALSVGAPERFSCRPAVAADAPAPEAVRAAPPPPRAPSTARPAASAARSDWREIYRRADYTAAFAAAEEQGFDDLARRADAPTLLELADLARLTKRFDLAATQYRALRTRFPSSSQAATAAFHLGRMSFTSDPSDAESWLSIYLRERPTGAFAAEAMGRLLELQQRAGRRDEARETAERYLAAFPHGGHAALARSILDL